MPCALPRKIEPDNRDSEPGLGTTVRMYLPRSRGQEDVETDVEAGPATGGTETVLIVEDDEDVRSTVIDMLSELGIGC